MIENLKKILEELVDRNVRDFNGKNFTPKRIVLFSSHKLKSDVSTTIFNYLQNRVYTTQWHIDNPIPVEIMPYYDAKRHRQEGDYPVDVGDFLIKSLIDPNEFLKL